MSGYVGAELEIDTLFPAGFLHVNYERRDRTLDGIDFLEPGRFAGITKGATGDRRFFENLDLRIVAHDRGIAQAGRAGTDHRNPFPGRKVPISVFQFMTGYGIYVARNFRTAAHTCRNTVRTVAIICRALRRRRPSLAASNHPIGHVIVDHPTGGNRVRVMTTPAQAEKPVRKPPQRVSTRT